MNSYFPYRWSQASLTFNVCVYLFLNLYMKQITINNDTPHLKSPKNQNRRAALGRPAIFFFFWGGGGGGGGGGASKLVCGRPTLALSSAMVPQTLSYKFKNAAPKFKNTKPKRINLVISEMFNDQSSYQLANIPRPHPHPFLYFLIRHHQRQSGEQLFPIQVIAG